MWVLHGILGANKGLGEAPKSCTRKEHESATNSIAKRGQGAIAPCRVKGQRPLWGLGQRPNCSTGDQYAKRAQQRRRQRSVPASNFALPQKRPPSCSFQHLCCVAPNGRDRPASREMVLLLLVFFVAWVSPLRRRPEGFAVALWTASHAHPCYYLVVFIGETQRTPTNNFQ